MKLADNEKQISQFFFKGLPGDSNNMSIITDRRLIVVYKNGEESYPLTKITAVKYYEFYPLWKIILGGLLLLVSILLLSLPFRNALMYYSGNAYYVLNYLFHYFMHPISILVLLVFFASIWLLISGFKNKTTKLVIGQMGGTQKYTVKKSEALLDFIEEINKKLK